MPLFDTEYVKKNGQVGRS